MTITDPPVRPASAIRIVVAAERLFALHGIEGVSLRQIAAAAGSGNNSAVHYHFGSKEALIVAIFEHRLPQLNRERHLLASRCNPNDLRSRIEAHYLPLLLLAEDSSNFYVSFVEQLLRQQPDASPLAGLRSLPDEGRAEHDAFRHDLDALLGAIPAPVRALRVQQVDSFCVHIAADRELARARGAAVPTFTEFADSVLDGIAAYLSVAPSPPRR